ncbi:hypothetical protein F5Y19DRAFT_48546 [Xylariaceae sp. FL1651]|nr:hypothetical protein F5Y19DRAFT_48546 [Xylariaceae sp. FL1651]
MAIGRTKPGHLLALGGLGAVLLWVVAFFNGTLDNMNAAIAKGTLPDGRPLRSTFTGIGALDGRIGYLVAFYEVLSNTTTLGPRLLFVNINFLIAATNIWVFVESRRRGVRSMALRHPVPFIILWLGLGAAFILPLYFWLHTRTKAVVRDPTVPHNEAIALFLAAIPSFLPPLLLFLPPWLGMSTFQHHGYIGLFLASPFFIVMSCLTGVALLTPWYGLVAKKDPNNPHSDKGWIKATYNLVGVLSAAVHLTCVAISLTSSDRDLSLIRVFAPSPGKMHSFDTAVSLVGGGGNVTLASSLPAAYHVLFEGYHLFTQLDYAVVSAACVVFTHWMLHNRGGDRTKAEATMSGAEVRDLALLILGTLTIGPGAAGSFALAAREDRIRQAYSGDERKVK